jgi:hypothetical protein
MATQDSPGLYERLGGVYGIATVVDEALGPTSSFKGCY